MTKLDQIKILDNKVKANEAQFNLDRKNAEILAKSSGKLDKYEYLTGEDLVYKPDALTEAKFEYSPLAKVFTGGLDEKDNKKEGLFKRLKRIENKSGSSNEESLPQLPYQERDVPRIENIDDDDDNDDDDDDERKEYERFKNIKKVLKEEGCLEKLVENETNKLYISLRNLKNKKYVIKREDANLLCQKPFNNDYLKLMSKYYNRKINSKYIIDLKKLVDDGIKLYYEDKSWRDAVAKNKIINSQKVSADLQRIIDAIKSNKFHRPGDFIKNPLSTNLSWMQDQDYYQEINNEIQNSFNTDGEYDAFPLLKEFLSNINDGTINNRKTAREYINDLKDESSSSIYLNVSKLEVAIFGPAKN